MADKSTRPKHPRAWSSHGEANRNSGNFTRGSQLIGHQFSMWWRGARVPLFIWFGLLAVFLWLKLALILDDYEFQMLGTKALAATWDFIGLDEMKRANVTLRDGSIYQTYMGYVSYTYVPQHRAAIVIRCATNAIRQNRQFSGHF